MVTAVLVPARPAADAAAAAMASVSNCSSARVCGQELFLCVGVAALSWVLVNKQR